MLTSTDYIRIKYLFDCFFFPSSRIFHLQERYFICKEEGWTVLVDDGMWQAFKLPIIIHVVRVYDQNCSYIRTVTIPSLALKMRPISIFTYVYYRSVIPSRIFYTDGWELALIWRTTLATIFFPGWDEGPNKYRPMRIYPLLFWSCHHEFWLQSKCKYGFHRRALTY